MNITEETNDYFNTTECVSLKPKSNIIKCELVEDNLKDKLKTTPDRGIKRISKIFRVDWSKIFKRGWLLWK